MKFSLQTPECIIRKTLQMRVSLFFQRVPQSSCGGKSCLFTDKSNSHLRLHPAIRWRKGQCSRCCGALMRSPLQIRSSRSQLLGLSATDGASCQLTRECCWPGPPSPRGGLQLMSDAGTKAWPISSTGNNSEGLSYIHTGVSSQSSLHKPTFS